MVYEVKAALVEWNPTAERLRELTEKMPNCQVTEFGNVVVKARVDSRSTRSTFVVADSTNATNQTITRAEYDRISAEQATGCGLVEPGAVVGCMAYGR